MNFRAEPPYRHGQAARTAVLLVALGTPDAPTAPALRRYLAEFLSDPRVVEIPRLLWWPILHGIILRTRPARSAAKYASIWTPEGSPLAVWTARQAKALGARLAAAGHRVLVRHAMRYGNPAMPAVLDALRAEGATRVLVLPMYPQYAAATTASVADRLLQWATRARRMPEWRFVAEHHDDPGYIAALAARLQAHWREHGRGERLILVPETVSVTFQSRFGKAKWLEPYTEPTLQALAAQGVKSVDVMCPGFVADCLETLEEIAQEARDAFLQAGGQTFHYVPCLNDEPAWIDALAALAERHLEGWPTREADAAAGLQRQRERALAMGARD